MRVYVVMGNDYPDAVFTTEALADEYCRQAAANVGALRVAGLGGPKIHWRYYDFELHSAIPGKLPHGT